MVRERFFTLFSLIAVALMITALITVSIQRVPTDLQVGMIATRDIKANKNYEIVDHEATQRFRQDAVKTILPVYDFDLGYSNAVAKRIGDAFRVVREQALQYSKVNLGHKSKQWKLTSDELSNLRKIFSDRLGIEISDPEWATIVADRASAQFEEKILFLMQTLMSRPIIGNEDVLSAEGTEQGVILRTLRGAAEEKPEEQLILDFKGIMTVDVAKELLESKRDASTKILIDISKGFIRPNVAFNRLETERRKSEAAKAVKDVIVKIKAGEIIVRYGSRYDESMIKLLNGIASEKSRMSEILNFFGVFILVFSIMIIPYYLAWRFFLRFKPSKSDYLLMSIVAIAIVIIFRISISLAPAIASIFFIDIPSEALIYAIPVASGAILIRLLLPVSYALVFSLVVSVFAGLFVETNSSFVAYVLISNLSAIIMFNNVDKRSGIIKGGMHLGAMNMVLVIGAIMLEAGKLSAPTRFGEVIMYVISAFVGGGLSAMIALVATPLVEGLSGHISDIKLLELSNLNHPLLRELIVRAPGTYHHSHLVGILSEAAAEKIGANALLVRVAAYYHDIGKIAKPQYFIENSVGENKHEKLSPNMSALILMAHVKDGLEMAKEAKLPTVIANMIPEHHGTRLITYFYEKAKLMEDEKHAVDKKDFCYQGPRPQSRESAILMLADAAEAAVRALKEKGSSRIQLVVQKVINDCFVESQLDECDLTLKDLNIIAEVFVHILLGIYHQRIEYPEAADVSNDKSQPQEAKARLAAQ